MRNIRDDHIAVNTGRILFSYTICLGVSSIAHIHWRGAEPQIIYVNAWGLSERASKLRINIDEHDATRNRKSAETDLKFNY